MKKKRILIPGWSLGENAWGVTKPYLNYFSQFGQVDILTPREEIVEGADLLVLPGGADINPNSYGQVPGFYTGNTDVYKQYFFEKNLPQYIDAGVPVFGICLGMQQLNVFFGGSLIQDGNFGYSNTRSTLDEDVVLIDRRVIKVNTLHHQAVMEETLSPEMIPQGISKNYGNIEIIKHKSLSIYGVQYHPEEINDKFSNDIIKQLLCVV